MELWGEVLIMWGEELVLWLVVRIPLDVVQMLWVVELEFYDEI